MAILLRLGDEAGSLRLGELVEVAGTRSTKSGMETIRVTTPARQLGAGTAGRAASRDGRPGRGAGGHAGCGPRSGDPHATPHQRGERLLRHRRRIGPTPDLREPTSRHRDRCHPPGIGGGDHRGAWPGDDREAPGPRVPAVAALLVRPPNDNRRLQASPRQEQVAVGALRSRAMPAADRAAQARPAGHSRGFFRAVKQQGIPRLEAPLPTAAIPSAIPEQPAARRVTARCRTPTPARCRPPRGCWRWRLCCWAAEAWPPDRRAWRGVYWRSLRQRLDGSEGAEGASTLRQ